MKFFFRNALPKTQAAYPETATNSGPDKLLQRGPIVPNDKLTFTQVQAGHTRHGFAPHTGTLKITITRVG